MIFTRLSSQTSVKFFAFLINVADGEDVVKDDVGCDCGHTKYKSVTMALTLDH